MKNLKELLSDVDESLLDDEDTILQDTRDNFLLSQAEKIWQKYPTDVNPGCDGYGRKLNVGEWVVFIPTSMRKSMLRVNLGVVLRLSKQKITIGGKMGTYSIWPSNVFKIEDKEKFIKTVNP